MQDDNVAKQDVGAVVFDYPNSEHPNYQNKIYYGNQYLPHATNSKAKVTNQSEVMRQVVEGK